MIRRTFNLIASVTAFALGTIYMFSDGASINANVVGSSGSSVGLASLVGIVMIIGAIGLFIVTLHHIDDHEMNLEKLVRRSKTSTMPQEAVRVSEPIVPASTAKETETHKPIHHKKK